MFLCFKVSLRVFFHKLVAEILSEEYWQELSAESAVLARVFIEYCLSSKKQEQLETASLPVVTAFALLIQDAYNGLLELLHEAELLGNDDEESEARDDEIAKWEVVLGELLRMALKLDYMDEIGRRKVFSVVSKCSFSSPDSSVTVL